MDFAFTGMAFFANTNSSRDTAQLNRKSRLFSVSGKPALPCYLMKNDRAIKTTKKPPARTPIRFNSCLVVE
jgi:hypothetical protein